MIRPNASTSREGLMRLGEAAQVAGVTVQQLHYYLLLGLVDPAQVSRGQPRLFDARSIRLIRLLRLLHASGYGLREIREIFLRHRASRR